MLGHGALGEFPLHDDGFTGPPVNVSLPAVTFALESPAPTAQAGKHIGLPALALSIDVKALAVRAGKHVELPALSFALDAPPIFLGISANVNLPAMAFTLDAPALAARAGKLVSLHHDFTLTHDVGALGEDALGAFALGEGERFEVRYTRPLQLILDDLPAVGVQAGKHIGLPTVGLQLDVKTPEIGARRRRLKASAVAS